MKTLPPTLQHLSSSSQFWGSMIAEHFEQKPLDNGPVQAFVHGGLSAQSPFVGASALLGDLVCSPVRALAGTTVRGRQTGKAGHFLERGAIGWVADRTPDCCQRAGASMGRRAGQVATVAAGLWSESRRDWADQASVRGCAAGARFGQWAAKAMEYVGAGFAALAHFSAYVALPAFGLFAIGPAPFLVGGLTFLAFERLGISEGTFDALRAKQVETEPGAEQLPETLPQPTC